MERRVEHKTIGNNVVRAIRAAGTSVDIVANATDIPPSNMAASLRGDREFKFGELVDIGGVLCVSPSIFMKGLAA